MNIEEKLLIRNFQKLHESLSSQASSFLERAQFTQKHTLHQSNSDSIINALISLQKGKIISLRCQEGLRSFLVIFLIFFSIQVGENWDLGQSEALQTKHKCLHVGNDSQISYLPWEAYNQVASALSDFDNETITGDPTMAECHGNQKTWDWSEGALIIRQWNQQINTGRYGTYATPFVCGSVQWCTSPWNGTKWDCYLLSFSPVPLCLSA